CNTNSTHIHTSTTQLTIHSFTITDINQAQPNQSILKHSQSSTTSPTPVHMDPYILHNAHTTHKSQPHTRQVDHNSQFTALQLPTSTKHNPTNPSSSIHNQV
ncbi:hypothetical protein LINPERHAP1_LOCUS24427, partial [Linum perenne]